MNYNVYDIVQEVGINIIAKKRNAKKKNGCYVTLTLTLTLTANKMAVC